MSTTLIRESAEGHASGHDASPTERSPREARRRGRAGIVAPWWFVVPAIAIYVFIVVVPSLRGAFFSFTDWNGLGAAWSWVGLENFGDVFTDRAARAALWNTVILAVLCTVIQNAIGLALAVGLHTAVKSRHLLRVIFFAPVVLTPLVSGYVWSYLLSPNGIVNEVLRGIGLGSLAQDWLGDPDLALYSVVAAIVWQFAGYSMVIFLAGLQSVPEELLEAATIDGAGAWRRFWHITFPLLNGAIVINVMLSLIGGLKQFDQVVAMTGGGPGTASETISTLIYKNAFLLGEYPFSVALAVIMTIIIAVLSAAQYRLTLRKGK
ncbi:carbohydrate ABC transporter permease [Microbacterium stercoris]|uniref:Sugar ABC transporter permease n=1 Tax=Microbacterium stercoris TaxID=2820289 RepID=A0A939TW38_9MICO|nr:sugar ABC transporter permease [Microbacterium stercoris]MBO3662237.1 sugar ABC transporter permease [Microbacterium stercoris]